MTTYTYQTVLVLRADPDRLAGGDQAAYSLTSQSADQHAWTEHAPRYEDADGTMYAVMCSWMRESDIGALPTLLTGLAADAAVIEPSPGSLSGAVSRDSAGDILAAWALLASPDDGRLDTPADALAAWGLSPVEPENPI